MFVCLFVCSFDVGVVGIVSFGCVFVCVCLFFFWTNEKTVVVARRAVFFLAGESRLA